MILEPATLYKKMIALRSEHKGAQRGVSTGFDDLNKLILLNKKYLYLQTGSGGMGKSEFMDAIALNTALTEGWKWLFFSPENFPITEHVRKYIQRYIGKGFWEVTPKEIERALEVITKHISWIDFGEDDDPPDVKQLLEIIKEHKKKEGLDAYVLDPWNEINHAQHYNLRDDQYIGDSLTAIRRFNRRHDLLGCIVIHPKSLMKDKDGNFPVPTSGDLHGGVMWKNKGDYIVCVHRHNMTVDEMTIYIQKVKFNWQGVYGCLDLDYDKRTGRFKAKHETKFEIPIYYETPF